MTSDGPLVAVGLVTSGIAPSGSKIRAVSKYSRAIIKKRLTSAYKTPTTPVNPKNNIRKEKRKLCCEYASIPVDATAMK